MDTELRIPGEDSNFPDIEASDEDSSILRRWRKYRKQSASHIQEVHERCEENWDFASATGDQWSKEDRQRATQTKQPALNINDVGTVVKSIAGREVTSRYQPKAYPPTEEDKAWTDVINEYVRHERARAHAEHEESDAFHDLQIQAYSWMTLRTEARNGRIPHAEWEAVPIWEMTWDCRARRANLMDREWHARTKWIDAKLAARRWPGAKEAIESLRSAAIDDEGPGGSQESSRRIYAYENATTQERHAYDQHENELLVTELEWKEREPYFEIEVLSGEAYAAYASVFPDRIETPVELVPEPPGIEQVMEQFPPDQPPPPREIVAQMWQEAVENHWKQVGPKGTDLHLSEAEFADLEEAYMEMANRPFEDWLDLERDVYRFAFIAGNHILDEGRRPERYWTYLVMCGWPHKKKDETIRYTCVDVMKDPQRWTNRFYSLQIELLATTPKNPLLYLKGTFPEPDKARATLARPNAAVEVTNLDGAKVMNTSNGMPQVDSMFEFAKSRVTGSLGLNPYALGQVTDLKRTAASSVQSVTQSASTILSAIFDSLRLFRIESTRLLLRKLQAYWTEEDLARVVGPKHSQFLRPKEEWDELIDFDVRIDEVPATPTQKMEIWDSLMQTGFLQQALATPYAPPPEIFVKLFPHLSAADEALWLSSIAARQEAAQQQQPAPGDGPPPEESQG